MSNSTEYVFQVGPGSGQVQKVSMEANEWNESSVTIHAYPADMIEGKFTESEVVGIMDSERLLEALVSKMGMINLLEELRNHDDGTMQNWCIDTYTREE